MINRNKIYDDIGSACDLLLQETTFSYGDFNRIYKFTNENIKDALSFFNLDGKKCLTVLGSSDQLFDMYLRGAKSVDSFDINPLTEYYMNLKIALLMYNSSLDEYMNFLCRTNNCNNINYNSFSYELYSQLEKYLDKKNSIFWNYLFEKNQKSLGVPGQLFKEDEEKNSILRKIIDYLNYSNFELVKNNISAYDAKYINCNVVNLSEKINQKYDFIYLSNIIRYVYQIFRGNKDCESEKQCLYKYKEMIMELSNYLNDNGSIVAGYLYNDCNNGFFDTFFNKSVRQVFDTRNFKYLSFNGVNSIVSNDNSNTIKDSLIVYTKK